MDTRTAWVALAVVALSLAPYVVRAEAQTSEQDWHDMRKEIETLKEGLKEVQKELQEMKALTRTRRSADAVRDAPPPNMSLSLDSVPFRGDNGANVVLVEFTDYECPFCARHLRETVPQLETEYVKTGKVRYAIRDFPLEAIHPHAFKAAEATHCAADQGKYWPMHDRLFANQRKLSAAAMSGHAREVGLDVEKFQECLSGGKHAETVRAGLSEGRMAGITGTPSFLLGVAQADGTVKVVKVIRGAQGINAFKRSIESVLASLK